VIHRAIGGHDLEMHMQRRLFLETVGSALLLTSALPVRDSTIHLHLPFFGPEGFSWNLGQVNDQDIKQRLDFGKI
jgi:hypothetical protein